MQTNYKKFINDEIEIQTKLINEELQKHNKKLYVEIIKSYSSIINVKHLYYNFYDENRQIKNQIAIYNQNTYKDLYDTMQLTKFKILYYILMSEI